MKSQDGRSYLEVAANLAILGCALMAALLFVDRMDRQVPDAAASGAKAKPTRVESWRKYRAHGLVIGNIEAPIQIVEFADFECPACGRLHRELQKLRHRYGDSLSISFVHYPLSYHRFALPAARAAVCAAEQGQFEKMHDILFGKQDSLGLLPFDRLAERIGIPNPLAFSVCFSQADTLASVASGLLAGRELGLTGTPTVIVNGWLMPSVLLDSARLASFIQETLTRGSTSSITRPRTATKPATSPT